MNENEKKAIESLKVKIEFMGDNYYKIMSSQAFNDLRKETKVALNLIEKLQKENEELKKNQRYKKDNIFSLEYDKETLRDMVLEKQEEIEELKKPKDNIQVIYGGRNYGQTNSILKEYISKDKIRKKMQEIMNYTYSTADERHNQDYAYDRLKELLEEE